MSCEACGAHLSEGLRFCPQCGFQVELMVAGLVLGNYELLEPLAAGAMGSVFKAKHRRLNRLVCVKTMHPELAGDANFRARFEQEASVLASMRHPNIVSALDFGDMPGGGSYLVLELIDGKNLRELLVDGPLTVERSIELTRQLLLGLEEVHRNGVLHRDLKPSNLLVQTLADGSQVLRLADFGVVRRRHHPELSESGLTRTGVIVGTPGYLSPEQLLGEGEIDARADLYGVGVVLYEMLAGQRLFSPSTGVELMRKHLLEAVPPVPNLSGPINAFVLRALAKVPAERFASALEMREALVALRTPTVRAVAQVAKPATMTPAPPPLAVPTGKAGPPVVRVNSPLVEQWKTAPTPAERVQIERQIEARLAEWIGASTLDPLLDLFAAMRTAKAEQLEVSVRGFLVERVGALARVAAGQPALKPLMAFVGLDGQERLLSSLRSVEDHELARAWASAVLAGPIARAVDRLPSMKAVGVGSLVGACAQKPFAEARPLLVVALNHPEASVRVAALKNLSAEQAFPLAGEVRKRLVDKDESTRSQAARLLGLLEDRAAVPPLLHALKKSGSTAEKLVLIAALGEIGGPDVGVALRAELAQEKQLELRCALADALGRVGDPASLECLRAESGRLLAPAAFKAVCHKYL